MKPFEITLRLVGECFPPALPAGGTGKGGSAKIPSSTGKTEISVKPKVFAKHLLLRQFALTQAAPQTAKTMRCFSNNPVFSSPPQPS